MDKSARAPSYVVGIRGIAWVILLAWAVFWVIFNVASAIGEAQSEGVGSLLGHLAIALIIAFTLLVLFRWEVIGGVILILESIYAWIFFKLWELTTPAKLFVVWTLPVPALLSCVLFILSWSLTRKACSTSSAGRGS